MTVCRFIFLVCIGSTVPELVTGQDSVANVCAVPSVDTVGWIRHSAGPFQLQLPETMREDTTGLQGASFSLGRGLWADSYLVVEWGVLQRVNGGALFVSGEQQLTRMTTAASQIPCLPTLPSGWIVGFSAELMRQGGPLSLWIMPPAPRESMYYFTFTAHSRTGWQRAVTAARALVLTATKQ